MAVQAQVRADRTVHDPVARSAPRAWAFAADIRRLPTLAPLEDVRAIGVAGIALRRLLGVRLGTGTHVFVPAAFLCIAPSTCPPASGLGTPVVEKRPLRTL
jgi:hypothetical protein